MKKFYEEPEMMVEEFSVEDVITDSVIDEGELGGNDTEIG